MGGYPEHLLRLRLKMMKEKISDFIASSECSFDGFVFGIQKVVLESYHRNKKCDRRWGEKLCSDTGP